MLSVAYAGLTTVPREALAQVGATLELLTLRGNRFHRTDFNYKTWDPFPPMPALRELDLSACRIAILPPGAFDSMSALQRLYLGNNRLETLSPTSFDGLHSLSHLDLSYNFATDDDTVPPPEADTDDGIIISPNMFAGMQALQLLDMSYTKLYDVMAARAFADLPSQLEHLSLCYTAMPQLSRHMFADAKVKVLDLSGNPMLVFNLHNNSLHDLGDSVRILAMDDANLRSLQFFCQLKRLQILLLSGNNINTLVADSFEGFSDLEFLDLSSNQIINWYNPLFGVKTPKLRVLKIHDNNINLITPAMFRDFVDLKFLSVGNNAFICSCTLRDFIDVAAANSRHTLDCPLLHPHLLRRMNVSTTLANQVQAHYLAHGLTIARVSRVQRPYDVGMRLHVDNMLAMQDSVGNMSVMKRGKLEYNVMMSKPEPLALVWYSNICGGYGCLN